MLGDRGEQHGGLKAVARCPDATLFDDFAAVDRFLDGANKQLHAQFRDAFIAKGEHLGEVVAGIHVEDGEWDSRGPEGFFGDAKEDD